MRAGRVSALALAAALAAGCGATARPHPARPTATPRTLRIVAAGRTLLTADISPGGRVAEALAARLPPVLRIRRGRALLTLRLPRAAAAAVLARAIRTGERSVRVPLVSVAAFVAVRPVRQLLRDDCEATALSMQLAAEGVRVGQLRLQAELPHSGPLDPQPVAGSALFRWGDPERGFVGRADGRGPGGGFGVYEPPIRALARKYGVGLTDLRGRSLLGLQRVLLSGRPVLAWVGLSAGPYATWLSPQGRPITVDFGEHAVLLTGAGPGYVVVNDPLTGRRARWDNALFLTRWIRLGRRALAAPRA